MQRLGNPIGGGAAMLEGIPLLGIAPQLGIHDVLLEHQVIDVLRRQQYALRAGQAPPPGQQYDKTNA